MANGIMNINPEQMARQQLAQGQPQPTFNQPGPNVAPNATMATSGVTPSIGPMNAQTKPATPFSIGADPFERMQDLKDMSDNQIYVGMQQGVITPVEGLITMQTRNEARRRHREQELAKQAGKKSVIEQVTDEFVSGIASNPQMQEEKPVIAKKEGGIINYQNRGLVGPYRRELDPQFIPPVSYGQNPYGDRRPGYMVGDNRGRRLGYVPAGTPDEQRKAEAALLNSPFNNPQNMADPNRPLLSGLGSQENYYSPESVVDDSPVGGEGILTSETLQDERAKRKYGEYTGGERRFLDDPERRSLFSNATIPLTRDQLVKRLEESGVDVTDGSSDKFDLMTGEENIGTPEIPFKNKEELINKYTNDARAIFEQKGADERTMDTMLGILKRESGYDVFNLEDAYNVMIGRKKGPSGEFGGFQLNPKSFGKGKAGGFGAKGDLSVAELSDFSVGANTAMDYFTGMRDYFGDKYGDLGVDPHEVAIAAYNTGPGNIEKILKNKDNVKALQEGASFISLLPESVQDYVMSVKPPATKPLTKEQLSEKAGQTGTPLAQEFPEAGVSTDAAEFSGEPSSEMLSQFTGQKPTEENIELEDEQQIVGETTSKDISDLNNLDDKLKTLSNMQRGVDKNTPNSFESLQDILNKSTSVDNVKKVVSELYPGSAVKEVTKIVDEAMDDLFKNKKDMENFYKGKQFISMAQAVMAPGQNLVQSLVNMVGVGAAEKEKLIKLRQSYSDKMVKLRTTKAQIMSADETARGKIAGDLYSAFTKANADTAKAYTDFLKAQGELSQKYIGNKVKLLNDDSFKTMIDEQLEDLQEAYLKENTSIDQESGAFKKRMFILRNLMTNAAADSYLQGQMFDPTDIYAQILSDQKTADELFAKQKEQQEKTFNNMANILSKPFAFGAATLTDSLLNMLGVDPKDFKEFREAFNKK